MLKNINLLLELENALVSHTRKVTRTEWLSENKEAISRLNELSDKCGLFSDFYREL